MTKPTPNNTLSDSCVMRDSVISRAVNESGIAVTQWFTGYRSYHPAALPYCRRHPWTGRPSDGKLRYDKKQGRLVWEYWTWYPYITNLNTEENPKWSVVFEVIRNSTVVDIRRRGRTWLPVQYAVSDPEGVARVDPGFQFINGDSPLSASFFEKWEAACGGNEAFYLDFQGDGNYIKKSMVVLSPAKLASRVFGWTDEKVIAGFVKVWEAAAAKQMNHKIDAQVLSGQDIATAYRNAVGYASCMTRDRSFLINFQAENPDKVKLLVVTDDVGKQSRMLVWFEGEGEDQKVWFDRQYPPDLGLLDEAAQKLWPRGQKVYRSKVHATNVLKLPKDRVFPYLDSYTQYLNLDDMETMTEVYIESSDSGKMYSDLQDPDKPVRMIVARENDTGGGPFAADGCRCMSCYARGYDKRGSWDKMELSRPWPGEVLQFICKECAQAGKEKGDLVQAFNMPGWWNTTYAKPAFKGGKAGWVVRGPRSVLHSEPLHPAQKKDWVVVTGLGYCPKDECARNPDTGTWEYVFPKGDAELKAPDPPRVEAHPATQKAGRLADAVRLAFPANEPVHDAAAWQMVEWPPVADRVAVLQVREAVARHAVAMRVPIERPNP